MNLENVNQYLKGDLFTGGLTVKIAMKENEILYRIPFLQNLVKNKAIIHVGCVDHIPLIENKIEENNWLHQILIDSSSLCIGIDNNEEGIRYLQNRGIKNVMFLDIIKNEVPDIIKNQQWDYMILGEILEHIDNPVLFLSSLRLKYAGFVKQIVITVPNAYTFMNLLALTRNVEIINSDHRYWFTPFTLAKICVNSGFKIESFFFARKSIIKSIFPFKKLMFKRLPLLRDTIIMIIDPE